MALAKPETRDDFYRGYQKWYTAASSAVRHLAIDRYDEFVELYRPKKEPSKLDFTNYGIHYFLIGVSWGGNTDPAGTTAHRVLQQVRILESVEERLDSVVARLGEVLQAELFESEVAAARELARSGHIRAAGCLAGVVIERHLAAVTNYRGIALVKKNPGIADYNDRLRDDAVIDQPTWRRVQFMADIRNLCSHHKGAEPTAEQVRDLIDGTEWLVASVAAL